MIRKESIFNGSAQPENCRLLVSYLRVSLCNFVHCLGIDHSTIVYLSFHPQQHRGCGTIVVLNAETDCLPNDCLKQRAVHCERMIKIGLRRAGIAFVVFTETTVKRDQRNIVRVRKTFQEAVILPKIQVRIER